MSGLLMNGADSTPNYDTITALAAELGRPAKTLRVSEKNDPFYITAGARRDAEWVTDFRSRLKVPRGFHLRRFHYLLISQESPPEMPDGRPYINTDKCHEFLLRASATARHLGLIAAGDLVDRRNPDPIINAAPNEFSDARLYTGAHLELGESISMPAPPELWLRKPEEPQPYVVELWIEKSTMNDILEPLARRYGCNIQAAIGEISLTYCHQFVERAKVDGRPHRVLYISDFDPAGFGMPVAAARKIEHRQYVLDARDVDIQLRPIVLTKEQCEEYRLPRTPIKETETRAGSFEERHGEGATELDALEALRPGELQRIIRREIGRYYDGTIDNRIREAAEEMEEELATITQHVHVEHADVIAQVGEEWDALEAARRELLKRTQAAYTIIGEALLAKAPDPDEIEWPEPEVADEDEDPLYSSERDYVEQVDRYKAHQGRETEGSEWYQKTTLGRARAEAELLENADRSDAEIGREIGLSAETIRDMRHALGLPVFDQNAAPRRRCLAAIQANPTGTERALAQAAGVSPNLVRKMKREMAASLHQVGESASQSASTQA